MVKFESKIEQQAPSFMKSNVFFLIPNCHSPVYHTLQKKKKNQSERDQDQLARADGLP